MLSGPLMSRLGLILAVAALSTALGPAVSANPNVIVIVSDDQGWADLGCQGVRSDVRTPNLDALAAAGVRFERGYASAPVCVPSRAGLLTGRYQTRFGIETNADGPLPASEQTIGDRMRVAGYVTGLVGKWHVATSAAKLARLKEIPAHEVLWGDNATIADPNLLKRGAVLTGSDGRKHFAPVVRFKDEPSTPLYREPLLGEHTAEVLKR